MKKKAICGILVLSIAFMTACGKAVNSSPASVYVESEPMMEYEYPETVYEEPAAQASSNYLQSTYESTSDGYYENKTSSYYDDYGNYNPLAGEEYSEVDENGFTSPLSSPLSTFAADVDTASYSNFRRLVNQGCGLNDIPAGAIRTEEMVNYFTYNYEEPQKGMPFGVSATISDCPWNEEAKLMVLGVNTNEMDSSNLPSSNIVFLIDTSGSMRSDNKLPLVKDAMELIIKKFGEDDRISIVTYASSTGVVLDGEKGSNHKKILRAFDDLNASGSTNGAGGLELAYETAVENYIKGGVNRVILCTDGDFNVGPSSESELEKLISDKRDSGIFLSVLGFGMGNYSDTRMETLADYGNGNYAYIDTLSEAKKVLVDDMTSTFVCIAKDVKLQVEFNPATVKSYRQVGYENRAMAAEDFTDDTKDGGEMGAGHQITVLYELILNDGDVKTKGLKYQKSVPSGKGEKADEYCTLSIAYKAPFGEESNYLEFPISVENYTEKPDEDFVFAAQVAETSLALRDSEFLADYYARGAIDESIEVLKDLDLDDEYRAEFLELLEQLSANGWSYYGYDYGYYYE